MTRNMLRHAGIPQDVIRARANNANAEAYSDYETGLREEAQHPIFGVSRARPRSALSARRLNVSSLAKRFSSVATCSRCDFSVGLIAGRRNCWTRSGVHPLLFSFAINCED